MYCFAWIRFFFLVGWVLAIGATPLSVWASVTGVGIDLLPNGSERVVFLASPPVTPLKVFTLPSPDRLVVDLPFTPTTGIALPPSYRGGLLRSMRFGQFDATTGRIVLELTRPVSVTRQSVEGRGIVLEIQSQSGAASLVQSSPISSGRPSALPVSTPFAVLNAPKGTARPARVAVAAPVAAWNAPSPSARPAVVPPAAPAPAPTSAIPASAPSSGKPLIVLDAGHGGQDPGALGVRKTREKDVTLAMAKAVQAALLRSGRYRVALTRSDDRYILLPDRVAIARRMKADMFISLHADSNPRPEARGLSIYTLSENASDEEAAALADRENKTDIIGGLDLNVADADVASILIDLTQRETMNKSTILADTIVRSLDPSIRKLPSTHRFAGFRVLKAPDIPSVLMELGFLSNAEDEKLLTSASYQQQVGASIVKGLDAYYRKK